MSLAEAEKMVLQVLKSNMEEKICKDNVELMVVKTSTRQWERRTSDELEHLIQSLSWVQLNNLNSSKVSASGPPFFLSGYFSIILEQILIKSLRYKKIAHTLRLLRNECVLWRLD